MEINGKRLDGVASEAAAQKLRGHVGTTVTVKVHTVDDFRSSYIREVNIPREVIKLSPISSAIIPHKLPDGHLSKTGCVKLATFSQTAALEMENTVHEVESQGVQSYILDLRNNPVEFQTASGQMIDLIITIEGEKDLSKYSLPLHRRIVQYKTAYYSFYLPVACALLMAGEDLDNHVTVQNVLIDMGIYFQVQDDYLDCFGEPEKIGKVNMDLKVCDRSGEA
ncbi:PREDICTED: farnesyl pyrophosphate synthase 1, mitochondrial-like [Erythranthe guttata]|uniref:farnesyl pyrophosphate synthase 1, mitochondrial-like n=1 Tax=Erythranthe guttata TaxID=4155 RepID=UPI00064D7342|nr:PREDICTED: farnesyl pyrophosphate synthase 1, mitochondrial-like [Erythranthe guttata]|eukprot:XP_012849772.1 PREDICTED: farnesyl pyrophosphate synthase 1, mitochondrial-like [Erythranthe guttata]